MALKKQSSNTNSERLTLRISKDLMAAAKQAAATYGLSLSAFVRMLIARELDGRRIKT